MAVCVRSSSETRKEDAWAVGRLPYRLVKRGIDIILSLAALVLGAPLAVAIALAIRCTSGAPVFFAQERVGCNGRRFMIYKFRTLPREPSDVSDQRWSQTAPPEAGRLGGLLRRRGLDEWPQFWNVLRGEMSVVGPRPERPHFAEVFRRNLAAYPLRQRLKAGITGWAQIHGLRGDSDISARLAYDLYYLRHWSLALDFKILLLTPIRAFRGGQWMPVRSAPASPPAALSTRADPTLDGVSETRDHAPSI